MSSFLCFICHSTVNSDTNEETRERYRDVVGMNLCPDSHLCYICYHVLNKLWLFKSVCLKRCLEYPVLFSEKGTINLHRNDIEVHVMCPHDTCEQRNVINFMSYHHNFDDNSQKQPDDDNDNISKYVELQEDRTVFDDYFITNNELIRKHNNYVETKDKMCDTTDLNEIHRKQPCLESNSNNTINDLVINKTEIVNENDTNQITEDVQTFSSLKNNEATNSENLNNYVHDKNSDPSDSFGEHSNDDENETQSDIAEDSKDEINSSDPTSELKQTATEDDLNKKKKKSKKRKTKEFEKIILSQEEQKAELEANRREKKYLEAEFKCYSCALGFLFKDTYQVHMMRHEESNGEYRCEICTLRFANPAVLRSHTVGHRELHRCMVCGETVRARGRAAHTARCQPDTKRGAACHLCGASFRNGSGLQQHLKRFHNSKNSNRTYACNVCGKSYNNQAAVRTHMITHVQRKFYCQQCPSVFSSPYMLSRHTKKHMLPTNLHFCETCRTSYESRKSLLAHKRNALVHRQTVFSCSWCGRVCPTAQSLSRHTARVHTRSLARKPARPSVGTTPLCHHCGHAFKNNSKLNRHLREVCEKDKLEDELSTYYNQQQTI